MKRKSVVGVVICLLVFALMALGSGSSDSSSKKDVVESDKAHEDKEEDESESDEKDKSDKEKNDAEDEDDSELKNKVTTDVTIEEQVLVDQDGIKITATDYTTDSIWGDGINLILENDTDKDYTIGCDALIVNDYMISDLFASTVAAGKKANETMYLSSAALNAAGIDSVGKVEMYFHAYDDDTYDNLFSKVYSEVHTSEYDNMDTSVDDSGTELYNKDGIRIIGKTVDENSFWGMAILLFCDNSSGRDVNINVDDMSINGFMMTPYFSSIVYDGKKAIDDITIMSSDLESSGVETIEDVELKFRITDNDSYETIDESDTISFSAK